MKPIKIGLIGCGGISNAHARGYQRRRPVGNFPPELFDDFVADFFERAFGHQMPSVVIRPGSSFLRSRVNR